MVRQDAPVRDCTEVADGIYLLRFLSPEIAATAVPGQFVNVRVANRFTPLLRRPFSIARVDGSSVELLFNVVGEGTRLLAQKRSGDLVDVLGPLGRPYGVTGSYDTVILVAGGLGVAPFPFLTDRLAKDERRFLTFVGARRRAQLHTDHLTNVHIATDDGSAGFAGNVIELLDSYLETHDVGKVKLFGCGPTPMLKALSALALRRELECELSLEGEMACGIGICQGCPVERAGGEKKYALVCTEGPSFSSRDIVLA